ncbi:MAG: GMP synthase (glutamine-hydrolyzing), partial [Maricaulis maris]
MTDQHDKLLIIDFGSQVTQLIARRVRESGVFCEIHPYNRADAAFIDAYDPKAIILSGSPHSTHWDNSPRADASVFTRGIPVLGICYGEQTMCAQLGGRV